MSQSTEVTNERTPLLNEYQSTESTEINQDAVTQNETSHSSSSDYLVPISKSQFWLIFGPILLQYFIAMFDAFFMGSSHPVITSYFNASNSASWLSTAFMLTSTASQPVLGRLSDTIGRRPVYLASLFGFTITTAWCGLATSIESFIAARAFCGITAGGMFAIANIMINDLVKIEVRGTYQAYLNLAFCGGALCGVAFGGLLCDLLGWRWTFAIQLPFVLLILIYAYYNVPADLGPRIAKHSNLHWWKIVLQFDLTGSLFLIIAVASLVLGLNVGGNILPWSHPFVIASLITFAISGPILIWVESRASLPVMPLDILASAPRSNLILSNFFLAIAYNHVLFNAPLYFQAVHGETPTASGLRLAIPALFNTCFAVLTGFFISWTGRMKAPQVLGAVIMLIGIIPLLSIQKSTPAWLATFYIVPVYAGGGFVFPATTMSVLAVTKKEDVAVVASTIILWRNLGFVFGVAISSLVLQNTLVLQLNKLITGPNKAEIIEKLRLSVRAILDLDDQTRQEASSAYAVAIRVTFISALGFIVLVNLSIAPVRLPRLGKERRLRAASAATVNNLIASQDENRLD